jgi:nucleoside-diphosphate-sugar epimerase
VRIFVAGAAGAIGRQLIPFLIAARHDVSGTTRDAARAEWLRSAGAEPIVLDVYDATAVRDAIASAKPQVLIHQLTDLALGFGPDQLRANARLRQIGTRNLVDAMLDVGVGRLIAQSGAWLYAVGPTPHTENDPLRAPETNPDDPVLPGIRELERLTLETPGITGIVLRYGYLYGVGTAYATREEIRDGPRVDVADAARAAALAIDHGSPGAYNIADRDDIVSTGRARDELGWSPR